MSEIKDIPPRAIERLRGLRREGQPGGIFTSDFSVNEFLLVRKAGFEPIGLCVGSCIYHLGITAAGPRTRNSASCRRPCIRRASWRWRACAKKPAT
jgi:hypothetical protein